MAIFAISDLHLSLNSDKPMNIFGSKWNNYEERMRENWNKVVTENDVVIIPGDISWTTYIDDATADFSYIHSLNGKKLILKGNHDYWWTTKNKMDLFLKNNCFDSVIILQNDAYLYKNTAICGTRGWIFPPAGSVGEDKKIFEREKQRLILSLENARAMHPDEIIVAMHFPPIDNNTESSDFIEIMKNYGVTKCVFGHLHAASQNVAPIGNYSGIKLKLVSCDYLSFIPTLIKKS